MLKFSKKAWEELAAACEAGYPQEVCGLLFRKDGGDKVGRIEVLSNILEKRHSGRLQDLVNAGAVALPKERIQRGGAFEFLIDPEEHYKKLSEASKAGYDQAGLFHSHPDHPAQPSATDAAQPYLSGWSNVIAAVHGGKFVEARSFVRETEDLPFQEELILVE